MTRTTRNVLLFAGALALGAFALRDASAGNYAHATAKYFSVEMTPGQYLYSSDERIVLVDDVTYSVDYIPCAAASACDFFTTEDIPNVTETPLTMPSAPMEGQMRVWGGLTQYLELVVSKHDWVEVALTDRTSDWSSATRIDRCSFATYGQLALRTYREAQGFAWWDAEVVDEPEISDYAYAAGAGGHSITRPQSMPLALTSVATSASRHYQSPHRVVNGRVYFEVAAGSVTTAHANVKGRTLAANDTTAPVVDTNIVVATP